MGHFREYFRITRPLIYVFLGNSSNPRVLRDNFSVNSVNGSKTSAIRHHAETTDHNIHPRHGRILEMNVLNYNKRLFLESLHSELDKNTVNERRAFPRAYVPLLRTLGGTQQQ